MSNIKTEIIDKIIRYLYYSLFFFVPLVMTSATSELFEFNKMLLIYLVAILVVFFWVLKMIVSKKINFAKTSLDLPIGLFVLSQILSTIFSIDHQTSLLGYYGRFNGGLFSTIAYVILYYGFVSNFPAIGSALFLLLRTALLSSFLVILWGLPGKIGYDLSCLVFTGQLNNTCWTDQFRPAERMFSTLGQPNWLGAYLAILFFVALYFLFQNKKGKSVIFYVYLALNFMSILFTRSRSALISVLLGLALMTAYIIIKDSGKRRKLGVLWACVAVLIIIFKTGIGQVDRFLTPVSPPHIQKTAIKTTNNPGVTESFDIRKIVWGGAINLGLRYPLFGTGVETFAYSYYFVRPKIHNLTSEWDFLYNKAHNEYLNYFATTGFVGIVAYLFLIGAVIFYLLKISNLKSQISNESLLSLCLFLSYLTILITNFFGFSTTTINIFFFLIPGFMIVRSMEKGKPETKPLSFTKNSRRIAIVTTIIVFCIFVGYVIAYFASDMLYAQSENYTRLGDYQKSASLLQLALRLHHEHVYEDKLSFAYANVAYLAVYNKQPDIAKKIILEADRLNTQSLKESPQNVLYWKTRAKNYYLFYQMTLLPDNIQRGIDALKKAEELSPTDPKIPYTLGIYYSLLSDEEKNPQKKLELEKLSLKTEDAAIALKPDFRDGYLVRGQLLKKYGNKNEAIKNFEYILTILNSQDGEAKKELDSLR